MIVDVVEKSVNAIKDLIRYYSNLVWTIINHYLRLLMEP